MVHYSAESFQPFWFDFAKESAAHSHSIVNLKIVINSRPNPSRPWLKI